MSIVDAITPFIGTSAPDVLSGGSGSEVMSGLGSDDILHGNSGNDQIWGGSGSDLLTGDSGDDVLYGGGGPNYTTLNTLQMASDYPATITFEGETAGYRNTLGWYKVNPDTGVISNVEILWENASLQGSGGDLIGGVSQKPLDISSGDQIGFFIISNGYSNNQPLLEGWDGTGQLEFQNADGTQATLTSTNPSLVLVADDGTTTQLVYHIYHTAGYDDQVDLNPDAINHTVGLLVTNIGILRLGFEDLYNGGDRDFDDAVFTVDIGTTNALVLSGWSIDPDSNALTAPQAGSSSPPPTTLENDTIWGGDGADEIHGRAGNDLLYGDAGDDHMLGGSGADEMFGGSGEDVLFGGSGDDTIDGGANADELEGGKGNDDLRGGDGNDNLNGRSDDDILSGGAGNDYLEGSSGNDVLSGGSGADEVRGGSGDDILSGGSGNDILIGGSGIDTLSFAEAEQAVTVSLVNGTAQGEGTDTISGIENLTGSDFDDNLSGNHRDNQIEGGDGADRLYGRNGDDRLEGGDDDDRLYGGSGDDALFGGTGDDVLKGYKGADVLSGGEGNDSFVYRNINEGGDVISDFVIGDDVINISSIVGLDAEAETVWQDYVFITDDGTGNAVIYVNATGTGTFGDLELATLTGVSANDLGFDDFAL